MKIRKTVWTAVAIALLSVAVLPAWAQTDRNITHVDLSNYFNNDGISTRENLGDGNFTGSMLYPAESLPASDKVFSVKGLSFKFPPKEDGMLNSMHCRGQVIDLPNKAAGTLYFLGASDRRLFNKVSGKDPTSTSVTLYYTDGETEKHKLRLTNWATPNPLFDNILAVRSKGFHVQNRINETGGRSMFPAGIYPKRRIPIDRVKLGNSESVQIFALTLSKRRPVNAVDSVDKGRVDKRGRAGPASVKVTLDRRVYLRGVTKGRADAYLMNIDVAELDGLKMSFELTDAQGKNPRRLAAMDKISPSQTPYEMAIQG